MIVASDSNWKQFEVCEFALVMFSAPWAGPCNLVRPAFENVAGRFGNQITFAEFDLDDNPETPARYGIKSVPEFILFERGAPVAIVAGAVPEERIIAMCESVL